MKYLILALMMGVSGHAVAYEEKHEHAGAPHNEQESHEEARVSSDVGPDKAVTAADPHQGIRLSPKAVQTLRLKMMRVASPNPALPQEALVATREEIGVYRLRDGWFQLVPTHELKAGDDVVVEGAGLVRVAHVAAFDGSGGHPH